MDLHVSYLKINKQKKKPKKKKKKKNQKKKKKKSTAQGTLAPCRGGRAYLSLFNGITKISIHISKLVSQESQGCYG